MVGHDMYLFIACGVVWLGIVGLLAMWLRAQRRLELRLEELEEELRRTEASPLDPIHSRSD